MNKSFYILSFFVILIFFQQSSSTAQTNLIYNGDFELYDSCPGSISTPGDYQVNNCLGWYSPSYATSDYFNSCASSIVGIPSNVFGYQNSYSGNAYCGILIENNPPNYGWWAEYLQSRLISSLQTGYEYEFSCRIVLSETVNEYAYSKFGAYFSNNPLLKSDAKPFANINPQVQNLSVNYLVDTLNWMELRGRFVAQGGERFITIGFFIDTLAPDTSRFTDYVIDPNNYISYYFIDACSMVETGNVQNIPNIFTPNNDGINDIWNPPFLEKGNSIHIYNRWGVKVYEISEFNQSWDGRTDAGLECANGVYYYLTISNSITKDINKGFIQLVR